MTQDVNNRHSKDNGSADMELEQKILKRSASFRVPEGKTGDDALLMLKSRIAAEKVRSSGHRGAAISRMTFLISSAAAGGILLLGFWMLILRAQHTRVVADKGTHIDYRLPDGSQVTLNAGSRIAYNKRGFLKDRMIRLEGEAFFDVVKGGEFLISTKYADIKVLGTSFDVYSRDNLFKVSCITGKISISDENRSVVITPGESASFSGKELFSYPDKNLSFSTGWIRGEFYFENSPLSAVFDEIARQFNVKFVVSDIGQKYFTGSFTNNDLKNTLDIVCIPMGLIYEIGADGKIFIRGKAD